MGTFFPIDYNVVAGNYQSSNYLGPGGPYLAVSAIYSLPVYGWIHCIVEAGRGAAEVIGGIVAWVRVHIKSPRVVELVGDAAEGGAVSLTQFFAVCVLSMGVVDWIACCVAVGLAAYTIFGAIRCAQTVLDGA